MQHVTKLLLALLAVIGGYALDTSPAQARIGGAASASEIDRVSAAEASAMTVASSIAQAQALPVAQTKVRKPAAPATASNVYVPSVQLADRPLE